jgi:hypothetical protein
VRGHASCYVGYDIGDGFDNVEGVVVSVGYEMASGEGIDYFERRMMTGLVVYPLLSRGLIMRVV